MEDPEKIIFFNQVTSLVIVGVGFHSTSQIELDLIVCETISTRVYLVNETDIMLYFQTSTQLLPIQEENWVMDHGLLLTFYFSLDGLFFYHVPSPSPKVPL